MNNSEENKNIYIQLFLIFFKIGLFTFGGGYAMIPIIEDICVRKKKWITYDEMMNVTVIAESTPGPVAINCSTYVGYKKAGLPGAILATCGVVMPSFIIIFIISLVLNNFLEIKIVSDAFKGIRVAVSILIIWVSVKMIMKMKKDPLSVVILIVSLVLMLLISFFAWSFSSIFLMIIMGAAAFFLLFIKDLKKKGGK